jgi:hypothetical protein
MASAADIEKKVVERMKKLESKQSDSGKSAEDIEKKVQTRLGKLEGGDKGGSSLLDKAKSAGSGVLGAAIGGLGAVQQATFRTGSAVAEGLRGDVGGALSELSEAGKALTPLPQKADLSFAQVATPKEARGLGPRQGSRRARG